MTFKVRLLLGAAAPLVFTLPAVAQVTISTATTRPVQTATANNGAASDVNITSAGSISLTTAPATARPSRSTATTSSPTPARSASVNSNDAVGVRIMPGTCTDATRQRRDQPSSRTTIRTDTDSDGDLDGPLAQGTGRVGILLEPGGCDDGQHQPRLPAATPSIGVEGNNTYGVSRPFDAERQLHPGRRVVRHRLERASPSTSARTSIGRTSLIGGARQRAGRRRVGVRMLGDVGGEFMIDGAIIATGFTTTAMSATT